MDKYELGGNMAIEGHGCDWDAELCGGPADGCIDRVIQENGDHPPLYFVKLLNEYPQRKSLGEKILEYWGFCHMDGSTKVAIYQLRHSPEDNYCFYDYVETTNMKVARQIYGVR